MTAPVLDTTMTIEEIAQLRANDCWSMHGLDVSVAESGPVLDDYYQSNPRWNYQGGVTGKFWDKVNEVANILKGSDEWPFEPLTVRGNTLYDGHHRSNAAMLVGWQKPIPVTESYCWDDEDVMSW